MKWDMDLARQILLKIEESPYEDAPLDIQVDGFNDEEISYHVLLLGEAQLVEFKKVSQFTHWDCLPTRLTWQGHEFLEAAKSETVWQKAKKYIENRGGALTLEVAKAVLAQAAIKQVGL